MTSKVRVSIEYQAGFFERKYNIQWVHWGMENPSKGSKDVGEKNFSLGEDFLKTFWGSVDKRELLQKPFDLLRLPSHIFISFLDDLRLHEEKQIL